MIENSIELLPADLAAGDSRSLGLDCHEFDLFRITSPDAPLFREAYQRLWTEFGPAHEMEAQDVIEQRLAWHPARAFGTSWLRYEMILVQRQGAFVATRDHTAIVTVRDGPARAIVHLSHVLVDPAWRRTGLAGWLRAWPIQTARACLEAAGQPAASPITLVAEMEHPDPGSPNRQVRLRAYEKAGFKKIDPAVIHYVQPDFRPAAQIDADHGARPLPFGLVIRRVGREQETTLGGAEVREIVEGLYRMYGTGFRERDMAVVRATLDRYPGSQAAIALVPPTR